MATNNFFIFYNDRLSHVFLADFMTSFWQRRGDFLTPFYGQSSKSPLKNVVKDNQLYNKLFCNLISQSGQLIIESIIVIPVFLVSLGSLFILITHLWIHIWAHHQLYENFICRRSQVLESLCHQKFIKTFNTTSLGAQVIQLKYLKTPNLLISQLKVRPLLGPFLFIEKKMTIDTSQITPLVPSSQ